VHVFVEHGLGPLRISLCCVAVVAVLVELHHAAISTGIASPSQGAMSKRCFERHRSTANALVRPWSVILTCGIDPELAEVTPVVVPPRVYIPPTVRIEVVRRIPVLVVGSSASEGRYVLATGTVLIKSNPGRVQTRDGRIGLCHLSTAYQVVPPLT